MIKRLILYVLVVMVAIARVAPAQPSELQCLTDNIYHEAPTESYRGKVAVATVTLNRVAARGFPKSICGVVYQHSANGCQFSWTCSAQRMKKDSILYNEAADVAHRVLDTGLRELSIRNAIYFHNTHVKPRWTFDKDVRFIERIGNHLFYS